MRAAAVAGLAGQAAKPRGSFHISWCNEQRRAAAADRRTDGSSSGESAGSCREADAARVQVRVGASQPQGSGQYRSEGELIYLTYRP